MRIRKKIRKTKKRSYFDTGNSDRHENIKRAITTIVTMVTIAMILLRRCQGVSGARECTAS